MALPGVREKHSLGERPLKSPRAMNLILSTIRLGGSVDCRRFLSRRTLNLIFEEQSNSVDNVVGAPLRFGVGFGLGATSTISKAMRRNMSGCPLQSFYPANMDLPERLTFGAPCSFCAAWYVGVGTRAYG
ncbi:hypothetical protein LZ30DRAFT_738351 [Colletotrichum cereale]|nr:hypothetical protein LZ30DRAFT_738351 [Colletotrichum cereale]